MDFKRDPQPGPSRPPRPSSPHRRESSWEFGDFATAPSSNQPSELEHGDLLGSFEDLNEARAAGQPMHHFDPLANNSGSGSGSASASGASRTEADLLQDEGWTDFFAHHEITKPPERAKPMTIDLPPRPDEMPANYVPPTPPPRMSQKRLSFSGPSSPPLISHAGADITFRPTSEWHRHPVDAENQPQRPSLPSSNQPRSPSQSKLMHTLATTTKIASKWKTVLDPSMFHPPSNQHPSRGFSISSLDLEPPVRSFTDPIEVTHTSPFATAEQLAGSYIPPRGAPSYNSHEREKSRREEDLNEKWPDTKLVGRRAGTAEILTPHLADALRQSLPPRQRLSNTWTLLFSLDQHGASLATLYRLIDKYAGLHRGAGNMLVVRDGTDRLFGVYLNENIQKREGTYYGSGESFMFKVAPRSMVPTTFRWTGRNQYFALCESGFASFGGGGASYGLILDSTFNRNSSATSPAYNNEVLCAAPGIFSDSATTFECLGVEVWGTQA